MPVGTNLWSPQDQVKIMQKLVYAYINLKNPKNQKTQTSQTPMQNIVCI